MKGFPAKKITFALILSIFPATTLGVVFLCGFFLTAPGKKALNGEQIKRRVYTFFAAQPPVLGAVSERLVSSEAKSEIINQYFELQNAPLAGYGSFFVEIAKKYNLPWTLLPAIAMQESNGGKKIPEDTYNAWGWGVTASDTLGFDSWKHGIETVARGLRINYLDRGLITPQEIMAKYCPLSLAKGGAWAKGVEYFQLELASF
ncbi:MAG: hypothetical protein ABH814_02175 [bacterium]